jgi:hypothetical protein
LSWHYNEALEQAMCDLQRPVAVRDQYFNCRGEVDEEFFDRYLKEAKPFKYAGYGIDPAYLNRKCVCLYELLSRMVSPVFNLFLSAKTFEINITFLPK